MILEQILVEGQELAEKHNRGPSQPALGWREEKVGLVVDTAQLVKLTRFDGLIEWTAATRAKG